jgi:hypothetical protein
MWGPRRIGPSVAYLQCWVVKFYVRCINNGEKKCVLPTKRNVTCDSDRQLLLVTDNNGQRLTTTDLFLRTCPQTLLPLATSASGIFLGYPYSCHGRHASDSRLVWCC